MPNDVCLVDNGGCDQEVTFKDPLTSSNIVSNNGGNLFL